MNSAGKRGRTGLVIIRMLAIMILLLPLSSMAGSMEPPAAPGQQGTMKTLDEIPPSWHQILPASERFELVMGDEAVLDKETGLVWARDANLNGTKIWWWSMYYGSTAIIGGRMGWRVPTIDELLSLIDRTQPSSPRLPVGHPFINVQSVSGSYYWSSTIDPLYPESAWLAGFNVGLADLAPTSNEYYTWVVRGSK